MNARKRLSFSSHGASRARRICGVVVLFTILFVAQRYFLGSSTPTEKSDSPIPLNPALAASSVDSAEPRLEPSVTAASAPSVSPVSNLSAADSKTTLTNALAQTTAFTDWLTTWRRANPDERNALAPAGRQLAINRRAAMKYLIRDDPRQALELSMPQGLRGDLPDEVRAQLESRIDARADLDVMIACFGTGETHSQLHRSVTVGDHRYEAFVFGRRAQQPTTSGLPIHGIAIDDVIAIEEMPYRLLDDVERSEHGIAPEQTAAMVGERLMLFASSSEWDEFAEGLIVDETASNPQVASASTGRVARKSTASSATSPFSRTLGEKRLLWIKVGFSDDPAAAVTDAQIEATDSQVNDFYVAASHGKTTHVFTILPAVLPLPKTKAYYNSSASLVSEIINTSVQLAKGYDTANGGTGKYDPDRYDRYLIVMKSLPNHPYGGVAGIGGKNLLMNGNVSSGVVVHELGHTHGLGHADWWRPMGSSMLIAGAWKEYGDPYDVMGNALSLTGTVFNVTHKAKIGFLNDADVKNVSEAGIYRLNRHDHGNASGTLALKIAPSTLGYEYWLEYRRIASEAVSSAEGERLQSGVLIHWPPEKGPSYTRSTPTSIRIGSHLIDGTPGSANGTGDAAVRVGETFTDGEAGITIRPVAIGGSAPNEYIDVQVIFGALDGNRNPTLQVDLPPLLAPRADIVFTASAIDPDNDPVSYRWDFGDSQYLPSTATVTKRFSTSGTYTLNVSAFDGKGGIATKTLTFAVVDPLTSWTRRGSNVTTAFLGDVIFAGGKFVAVGDGGTVLNSADAITWTRTTAPGSFNLRGAACNGTRYAAVGIRSGSTTERGGAVYSDNGSAWTSASLPDGSGQLFDVAYGADRFVAVGENGLIYASSDGAIWSKATSSITSALRSITYTNNLFVAGGDNGRLLTSSDGITWADRSIATTVSLGGITYFKGLWHVANGNNTVFTSADTITWTKVSSSVTSTRVFQPRLTTASGMLIGGVGQGNISFAESAESWVVHQIHAPENNTTTLFASVAEGNGVIVTVGSLGLIYSASPPPSSSLLVAPALRREGDSLKLSAGKANIISANGTGFAKLELYANGAKVSEIAGTAGAFSWTPPRAGSYTLVVRGVDASGASAVSGIYEARVGLAGWRWVNATPVGTDLNGAIRVGDTWWIAGGCGTLLTLDASGTLTALYFPTQQHLTSIHYANGRFLMSAPYFEDASRERIGSLWTSTDGYAWTPLLGEPGKNWDLLHVGFGGGQWVATSSTGIILTSSDGLAWTQRTSPVVTSLRSASYGNGTWAAVGESGKIITSPDGVTWASATSGVTNGLSRITFHNGNFIVVGDAGVILTSTSGASWTRQTSGTTNNLSGIGVVRGSLLAVGNNGATLSSTDGITWSAVSLEGKFSNALFVAGGGDQALIIGKAGEVYWSGEPSLWRRINQGSADTRNGVIYAGGRFVVVGQTIDPITRATIAPISVSTDGINWTRAQSNAAFTTLQDVAYEQQTYVAVGDSGRIFSSNDAMTWTERASGVTNQLLAVAASPSGFVAAGVRGIILSSPDGIKWTSRATNSTRPFQAAAYGAGRYVVAGEGLLMHSSDGVVWANASGPGGNIRAAGWFPGDGFLVAGDGGGLLQSADGVSWQLISTRVSDHFGALAKTPYGLAVSGGRDGTLLLSIGDGEHWPFSVIPTDQKILGMAVGPSAIVAVGENGNLLTFEMTDTTPAPVITAQPASQSVTLGSGAVLSVKVQNAVGGVFQWLKDGVPIVGANNPLYSIPVVDQTHLGAYSVSIQTPTGSATSTPALLSLPRFAPVLPSIANQSVREGATFTLQVAAANSNFPPGRLTYTVSGAPPGMNIDPATGMISWTPDELDGGKNFPVTVTVADDGTPALTGSSTFAVTVLEMNSPPTLSAIPDANVRELEELVFTVTSTDPDLPANTLTFSLASGAPPGASISPSGAFRWRPDAAQGPGVYSVTVSVTDDASPPASDSRTFTVTVIEVNAPPTIAPVSELAIDEGAPLQLTIRASDPDLPAQSLTFRLAASAPAGATIEAATGLFTWTPTEIQGPSTNQISVIVTDSGNPTLSTTNTLLVVVNEVNTAPVLSPIGDLTGTAGNLLTFTAVATDADQPPQRVTYSLDAGAPAGAQIDAASGLFTWTPAKTQAPSTNSILVRVTDNGSPPLGDTKIILAVVTPAPQVSAAPILSSRFAEGRMTVEWPAQVGRTYRVQFKNLLSDESWIDLDGDITAMGSTAFKTDSSTNPTGRRFYRVLTLPSL